MDAATIVTDAQASIPTRIERAIDDVAYGEWSDAQRGRDYVAVLRSLAVWAVDDHTVAASVADTRDGRIWNYVASDVLDGAVTDKDFPESTSIDQAGPVTWQITW